MTRCVARFCERSAPSDRVAAIFCDVHWERLPSAYRASVANAYGTPRWQGAVREARHTLHLIDARLLRKRLA